MANNAKKNWMKRNGFCIDDNGIWLAIGNSYSVKDILKAEGYKYNKEAGWHGDHVATLPAECECWIVFFDFDEVAMEDFYGVCDWRDDIAEKIKPFLPKKESVPVVESNSIHVGELKERLRDMKAKVKSVRGFEGAYGYTNLYTFSVDENIFTWFTSKYLEIEEGDEVVLTGTVKKHDEFRGVKQTVLTRCIVKEV